MFTESDFTQYTQAAINNLVAKAPERNLIGGGQNRRQSLDKVGDLCNTPPLLNTLKWFIMKVPYGKIVTRCNLEDGGRVFRRNVGIRICGPDIRKNRRY
jgi:hypothetical protein